MTWDPIGRRGLLAIAEVLARITATTVWLVILLIYVALLAAYWVGIPAGVYYLVLWSGGALDVPAGAGALP